MAMVVGFAQEQGNTEGEGELVMAERLTGIWASPIDLRRTKEGELRV
jgi:hypothetical protein